MRMIKTVFPVDKNLQEGLKQYLKTYPASVYGTYVIARYQEQTVNYVTGEYEWVPVDLKVRDIKTLFFDDPTLLTVTGYRFNLQLEYYREAWKTFGVPIDG